jgi:hypothetical protein
VSCLMNNAEDKMVLNGFLCCGRGVLQSMSAVLMAGWPG